MQHERLVEFERKKGHLPTESDTVPILSKAVEWALGQTNEERLVLVLVL
jgi:hypothetical protein